MPRTTKRIASAAMVCVGMTLVVCAPASAQDEPLARRLADTYGVVVPRPVDAERRVALGYPEPRAAAAILAEIDAITEAARPITQSDEVWKQRFREYRAMQRHRITLISELEESGYDGSRLEPMLALKLEDIGQIYRLGSPPWASFGGLREEMARRYEGSSIGALARANAMHDLVSAMGRRLRVHPDDFPKLAAIEEARDDEEAGILLLDALHFARDEELTRRWFDWIEEHLDHGSLGYRVVKRERMFGSPIVLEGPTLDGGRLTTRDWAGRVVLVDFWGLWCAPCIAAMPELKQMKQKYGARGLEVLGVLVDHEFDRARRFVAEHEYRWPQLIWPESTAETMYDHPVVREYAVGGYPTLWIIDREGRLREQVDRDRLEETILKYLDGERP